MSNPTPEREPLDLDAIRARVEMLAAHEDDPASAYYSALDVPALLGEIERLHSWAGLMSLLDEHYPDTVFPTLPDREGRDLGARVVSLLRTINILREEIARLQIKSDAWWEAVAVVGILLGDATEGEGLAGEIRLLGHQRDRAEADRDHHKQRADKAEDQLRRREVRWAGTVEENGRLAAEVERLRGELAVMAGPDFHVVEFTETGWTIMHPLACRPNLFDCQMTRVTNDQVDGPPPRGFGQYRCDLDDDGWLRLHERVDASADTAPAAGGAQ